MTCVSEMIVIFHKLSLKLQTKLRSFIFCSD